MSEPPRYRDWILETIDSLRSRKARPDLERICRMVRRRHGSDPERTRAELEKLIQERSVLKVNYKGSVSYRNAARVQRKCRSRSDADGRSEPPPPPGEKRHDGEPEEVEEGGEVEDPLGDRLVAAVWSLSARDRTRAHQHQPLGIKEILGQLAHARPYTHADGEKLTRHRVRAVLEREIERGRLRRTRLGHIAVTARTGRMRGGEPHGRPAELEVTTTTTTYETSRANSVCVCVSRFRFFLSPFATRVSKTARDSCWGARARFSMCVFVSARALARWKLGGGDGSACVAASHT